jgi:hypothetical protein
MTIDEAPGVAPQFTAYVHWKNGDRDTSFEEISGYSVSEGCLFLSREWSPGLMSITGIPLSGIQSYELIADPGQ